MAAVIPTWNRADLVRSLLTALQAQTRAPDQVVVVDNGSTDDTLAASRAAGADCVALGANRGFAVAVNEGIQYASADWILILNNDLLLPPDWLETLLGAADSERADFAAGKLLQSGRGDRRMLDGSWDLVSRGAYAWRCGYERPDGSTWSARRTIAFAPMTAVLFRKRIFEQIGLLETRFESYYEDVDFGIRCALAGLKGVYEPNAVAVHLGKATLGKRAARVYYLSARNQVLLLAKHYPEETLRRFAWPIAVGQTLALLAATKQKHPVAALRGKWEGLRRWRDFREALPPPAQIESVTATSEREIYELQRSIGFDIYWRLYFSLVPPA